MPASGWLFWLLLALFLTVCSGQTGSCAGTSFLNATTQPQYLTTPNYESSYKYPPFLDCRFVIKAPDKTRIVIDIIDMEMEPRIFDECVDFVGIVEDVLDRNSSKMLALCETIRNQQYISNSSTVAVVFQSDDLVETRGVRLSYRYYELNTCPPGWTELSDRTCVKLETEKQADWIRAQNRCLEMQSNLIEIESLQKTSELEGFFLSVPSKLWVGYTDSITEGKLVGVDDTDAISIPGRDQTDSLTDNNDDNDCMTLQFGDNQPYRMDSCASYNGYICEMKKDGTTELHPPPVQDILDGAYSRSSQYTLWLLLFLIGLLFLTILAFLCFMCWKQKDGRVHSESATIQQNAFMSDSSHRVEQQSRSSTGGQTNAAPVSAPVNETIRSAGSRSSPVTVPLENNRPPKKFPTAPVPNRLPMAEEPSETEHIVETNILGSDGNELVSAVPVPQPRTLPPMPAREGTFQSIGTREGSTIRTRRNKELFERPIMHVLDNVSAISLDEFWSNKRP